MQDASYRQALQYVNELFLVGYQRAGKAAPSMVEQATERILDLETRDIDVGEAAWREEPQVQLRLLESAATDAEESENYALAGELYLAAGDHALSYWASQHNEASGNEIARQNYMEGWYALRLAQQLVQQSDEYGERRGVLAGSLQPRLELAFEKLVNTELNLKKPDLSLRIFEDTKDPGMARLILNQFQETLLLSKDQLKQLEVMTKPGRD